MNELVEQWIKLNDKAIKLMDKHISFRSYNIVRLKMDKLEHELLEKYDFDIVEISYVNGLRKLSKPLK